MKALCGFPTARNLYLARSSLSTVVTVEKMNPPPKRGTTAGCKRLFLAEPGRAKEALSVAAWPDPSVAGARHQTLLRRHQGARQGEEAARGGPAQVNAQAAALGGSVDLLLGVVRTVFLVASSQSRLPVFAVCAPATGRSGRPRSASPERP